MQQPSTEEEIARTRIPRKGEIFAVVMEMLGAGKMRCRCEDGFTRICRVPGRIKKRVWIRRGDLILVEPWKVQSNEKADIIWKYTPTQASWLKRKGYAKSLQF